MLIGCGSPTDEAVRPGILTDVDTVTLVAASNANRDERGINWPVSVDLVRSNDERVLTQIGQLSAREWFGQKEALLSDNPTLEVDEWEITPGQTLGPFPASLAEDLGGFIFANYLNIDHPHRLRLEVGGELIINLDQDNFSIHGDPPLGFWSKLWPF